MGMDRFSIAMDNMGSVESVSERMNGRSRGMLILDWLEVLPLAPGCFFVPKEPEGKCDKG